MTKIISIINMKGGVAKTTTTVGLAQFLSKEYGKKVLVIDLDAQTNATVMLIGEAKWLEVNKNKQTIAQLFEEGVNTRGKKIFDINVAILKNVSNVREVTNVDLLPSSLDLLDIQEDVINAPRGIFSARTPIDILSRVIEPIKDKYNYILIDCPPSTNVVTRNGLSMSDYYIIPAIPDVLSTYGIPQIKKRIEKFGKEIGRDIVPLGLVVTKYREQSSVHKSTLLQLNKEKYFKIFKTKFKECDAIAGASEYVERNTLKQKWGYSGQADDFKALALEIIERVEKA